MILYKHLKITIVVFYYLRINLSYLQRECVLLHGVRTGKTKLNTGSTYGPVTFLVSFVAILVSFSRFGR